MRDGFGFGDPEFWFGPKGKNQWRGQRRNWFESGDMKYVILTLLLEKPMHGYEVMKALEEETSWCYKPSPGTVYPTLQWLEDEGLVKADDVDGKKVYAITDTGRAFLEENKGTVDDIFDRVSETINRFVGEPIPEINRAVGRLVAQAYRAAWKHGQDEPTRRRISEILEQAAKDLEGLATPKP
jgi:DNA-binding PadR family transcriptional regulator